MKRKATAKQLRALAKGRKIRKANLRKLKQGKRKRRNIPRKPTKRRRTNLTLRTNIPNLMALTGGTGDVNPQYMTGNKTMAVADAHEVNSYPAPVAKGIFGKSGKATILEILKVYVSMPGYPFIASVTEVLQSRNITFSTTTGEFFGLGATTTFASFSGTKHGAFTAGGTYATTFDGIFCWDLTDNAGHGYLLAADNIFVAIDTNGYTPTLGAFSWKIMYRYKNVSLPEFIGITQSQQ